jgi:hypothetical protein
MSGEGGRLMSATTTARKPRKVAAQAAAETTPLLDIAAKTERRVPIAKTQEHYSAEGSLALAIGKIEAAAWLMDQIEIGELGFLTMKPDGKAYKVPCWLSVVEGSADNLAGTLEHWAIETIAREVQVIRRAVKVLCPEVYS